MSSSATETKPKGPPDAKAGPETDPRTGPKEWCMIYHRAAGIEVQLARFSDPETAEAPWVGELLAAYLLASPKVLAEIGTSVIQVPILAPRLTIAVELDKLNEQMLESKSKITIATSQLNAAKDARTRMAALDTQDYKVSTLLDAPISTLEQALREATTGSEQLAARHAVVKKQQEEAKGRALYAVKMLASTKVDGLRCFKAPSFALIAAELSDRARADHIVDNFKSTEMLEYIYVTVAEPIQIPVSFIAAWHSRRGTELDQKKKDRTRQLEAQLAAAQKELEELHKS